MLRVQPTSPAPPTAPLVILFDHPVAPKLDASIDPARVLKITPSSAAHIFWRDPSTIVAEFDSPWPAGSTYDVTIDPKLRSTSRAPLARTAPSHIQVEMPRALALLGSMTDAGTDTTLRPAVVYSGRFDLAALAGHAWFVPRAACGRTDSVAMTPTSMRAIDSHDAYQLREAGGYERNHRTDSERRVVELRVEGATPRGCRGELHVPLIVGGTKPLRVDAAVRLAFRLDSIGCAPTACERGPIVLKFANAVSAADVRANVFINGKPARYQVGYARGDIVLLDSVQPKQSVTVTVSADLKSSVGERLGRDTTAVLIGRPFSPAVGFVAGVLAVPRDEPTILRVRHVNTDSIVVIIARVPEKRRLMALTHVANEEYYRYGNPQWRELAGDSVTRVLATPAPRDSEVIANVPLSMVPAAWRDDPLLLVRARPFHRPMVTDWTKDSVVLIKTSLPRFVVLARSNIAAHAMASTGKADVWVTSLRDGRALAGASIQLFDDTLVLATGVTDSLGRARLNKWMPRAYYPRQLLLEATRGPDRTLLAVASSAMQETATSDDSVARQWWTATSPSRIGLRSLHGSAFTDRGIYRPGERVFLSGAIRTFMPDEGYRVPTTDSARFTVWHRRGYEAMERVWSHVGRLSDFGTLTDSFTTARTAPLGTYLTTLALRGEGDWRTAATTEFRVEEYRAPEFAVHLTGDTAALVFGGDSVDVRVDARYLFGLAMAGGEVSWWTDVREREPWELKIPGLEKYTVGRASWRLDDEHVGRESPQPGTAVLGIDGTVRLKIPTALMKRPGTLTINASVADKNRQTVSAPAISVGVQAANAYLGMRTRESRWVWRTGDSVHVELLVARSDGTLISGSTVTVVAQRSQWMNGAWVRDTVWTTTATSAAAPVTVTFAPQTGGNYELIGSVTDERGRRAQTGLDVWVTGENPWWATTNPRIITIRGEQKRYAPGDTATLLVESPAEQRAWVSVRDQGLAAEQMVALHRGITEVRVPVPLNTAASVAVHLLAVRPFGIGAGDDSAGIYYRTGAITLAVDTARRSLTVAVSTDRTRYRPRDTVRVELAVADIAHRGRASELTVWAVDEGVIMLTAYTRPAMLGMLLSNAGDNAWFGSTLLARFLSTPPQTSLVSLTEGWMFGAGNGSIQLRGM
ncbi:MAG: alpha-2-macroglobulin domain protein 2 [Gemmatimonadetes bacterium]|nr:alpha-2-macroglobulin domain protein 2 [Gemmatimonadota bacterium]